jgi:hypothetical protein
MTTDVAVLGWGAFVPGFDGAAGFVSATPSADHEKPKAEIVPPRQRRRASQLSKALADAYGEALSASGVDASTVASVFGSAIGEASTMIGLLDQMWGDAAMLSPMRFATSVHNAASGMVSIATENRGITTAIGADYDTPAMALFEGMGLVEATHDSVVVCCGDEAPPEDLVADGAGWTLMTAAVVLGPTREAPLSAPRLSDLAISPSGNAQLASSATSETVGRNPNAGLLDLVAALCQGADGVLPLDRGLGRGYAVRIHAATP